MLKLRLPTTAKGFPLHPLGVATFPPPFGWVAFSQRILYGSRQDKSIKVSRFPEAQRFFDGGTKSKKYPRTLRSSTPPVLVRSNRRNSEWTRVSSDDDGSGSIGNDEFLKMMTQKILNRGPNDATLKAFRLFDDDETGQISVNNLTKVILFFLFRSERTDWKS